MKARAISIVLLLTAACRLPPAELEIASESAELPRTFVEANPEPYPSNDPVVPSISAGQCSGEVEDYPEVYFNERVLIRVPKGVNYADFVEVAPDRAQLVAPATLQTCLNTRLYVTLERMIMEWRVPDPSGRFEPVRDEVMRANNLFDDATLIEAEVHERGGEWVFELPSGRLLVAIHASETMVVVAMYLVPSYAWPVTVESLRASGRRISLLPPP